MVFCVKFSDGFDFTLVQCFFFYDRAALSSDVIYLLKLLQYVLTLSALECQVQPSACLFASFPLPWGLPGCGGNKCLKPPVLFMEQHWRIFNHVSWINSFNWLFLQKGFSTAPYQALTWCVKAAKQLLLVDQAWKKVFVPKWCSEWRWHFWLSQWLSAGGFLFKYQCI